MKKPLKIGLIFGIVGATFMIIGGIFGIIGKQLFENLIQDYSLDRKLFDSFLKAFTISSIGTLIFGIIGISGVVLGFLRLRIGFILLCLVGLITVLGGFIPIHPPEHLGYGLWLPSIPLSSSLLRTDPFFILLGGILGVIGISSDKKAKKKLKVKNDENYNINNEARFDLENSYQLQTSEKEIIDKIKNIVIEYPLNDYNRVDLTETVLTAYNVKQYNKNISDEELLEQTKFKKPTVNLKIFPIAINIVKKLRFKPEYLTKEIQDELDLWDKAEN